MSNFSDTKAASTLLPLGFGVDPDVCTGDHSCMRLNGCPSLTLRENPDPLRDDPIAHVSRSSRHQ
jgi:indolepyruvate ferredoxin oxidoreductase alpha subunit